MKYELRDYQIECVDTVLNGWSQYQSQLVQLPTGSGKTVILWHILKRMNERALIVAPTIELTEQIEETGLDIIGQGIFRKQKRWAPVVPDHCVCTHISAVSALKKDKLDDMGFTMLIIDEAHRSKSEGLEKLVRYFRNRDRKVLGLTATPERADQKNLMEIFDVICFERNLIDMMQVGHLVDLECIRIKTRSRPDRVTYKGSGDFSSISLRQLDTDARNSIILKSFDKYWDNRKTLIFCLDITHSKHITSLFQEKGIRAEHIDGSMNFNLRKDILRRYRNGSVDVLCNCQVLTEGFDEPSIELLILARPTKSKALYCQMIGRGVRPFPGKEFCTVIDMGDTLHNVQNFNALGGIPIEREFPTGKSFRLTHHIERERLSLDDIDIVEETFSYGSDVEEVPAFPHQIDDLKRNGIGFHDGISFRQAAYLLFKDRILKEHGINTRDHWEAWKPIPCSNTR